MAADVTKLPANCKTTWKDAEKLKVMWKKRRPWRSAGCMKHEEEEEVAAVAAVAASVGRQQ